METVGFVINQILKQLPNMNLLLSPIDYLTQQSFKLINFILQSILFSTSVVNAICVVTTILGLTQVSSMMTGKLAFLVNIVLGIVFLWLHLWKFSDEHYRLNEIFHSIGGFYVAFCCVEGCVYIKQKIDPTYHSPANKDTNNQQEHQQIARNRIPIGSQLVLIIATVVTTIFFIFMWYNVKVSKQIPQLHGNYRLLAGLLLSTILIYTITLAKGKSLFLPAILSCLCVYLPISIRYMLHNHSWTQFNTLNIPVYVLPILFISLEGRQKHIRQQVSNIRIKDGEMDKQYVEQKIRTTRILLQSMYWAALGYFLYSLLHGSVINIEFMVVAIYVVVIAKGSIL